jgi:hypothetical protein
VTTCPAGFSRGIPCKQVLQDSATLVTVWQYRLAQQGIVWYCCYCFRQAASYALEACSIIHILRSTASQARIAGELLAALLLTCMLFFNIVG